MRKILTALIAALAALFAVSVTSTPTMAAPAPHLSQPHASQQAFATFYGRWDNTPPGGDISYPRIHQTAGGTGTWTTRSPSPRTPTRSRRAGGSRTPTARSPTSKPARSASGRQGPP